MTRSTDVHGKHGAIGQFIRQHGQAAKVRPDMKVVFFLEWETTEERVEGTTTILRDLANLAEGKKVA